MIDHLIQLVRKGFESVKDHRGANATYKLADLLSAGFAMFSLKDPSLLIFRKQISKRAENLERVYGITNIPKDTALRKGLDKVNPTEIEELFKIPLAELRSENIFKERQVLGGYTAISCDATGHYCSSKQQCPHCLVKNYKNGGQQFYHQLLSAVMTHPSQKTVFPIANEAIIKQDGSTKNDCERNASKRLIPKIRAMLPDDKLLLIFDALYANGPHLKLLLEHKMSFISGIKGGYVMIQKEKLASEDKLQIKTWKQLGKTCTLRYVNHLILNGQHQDLKVNYFEYEEIDHQTGDTIFFSSWITDILITPENCKELVAVARCRWKIENETFNTLKNQGYHLEHNYGHGKHFLATNFALLTMLAFLVDQIAQQLDEAFQKAWNKLGSKKLLWIEIRETFNILPVMSMNVIYRFILGEIKIRIPPLG